MKNIVEKIKDTVRPIFERQVEAKLERIVQIQEIKKSDEYKAAQGAWAKHALLSNFSKKEITLAADGMTQARLVFVRDMEHQLKKIDDAVAKKLVGIDVTDVECLYCGTGKDTYVEGAWKIKASDGVVYFFEFRTTYAGGYNIQCLHVRTIYSLRSVKGV